MVTRSSFVRPNFGAYFVYKVQVPVLWVFVALLWLLIIVRIWTLHKSNRDFPSRWRHASVFLIVLSGLCCIVQPPFWMKIRDLNNQAYDILIAKAPFVEGTAEPDWDAMDNGTFTVAEAGVIADVQNRENYVYFPVGRLLLIVALWTAKLCFCTNLLATAHVLRKGPRCALYVVTGILASSAVASIILGGVVLWHGTVALHAEDVIPYHLTGLVYGLMNPLESEYALTGINAGNDVLLACLVVYIITSMSDRAGHHNSSIFLLCGLLAINVAIAITRAVILYYALTPLIKGMYPPAQLFVGIIVLSEYEILLNVVLSCVPGLREWFRQRQRRGGKREEGGSSSSSKDGPEVMVVQRAGSGRDSPDFLTRKEEV